ncbi:hypothetical protein PR048_021150 [Dryococelus australis]|uniref:YqaJ viral recombinase domain-containing protein n=1 Tax=Dryococelus australis TaxID=614101 RepID=A0ABQ9GXD5_9NEOP|nr:hypothetical protein PR048_021150 [Dryococelus australis]
MRAASPTRSKRRRTVDEDRSAHVAVLQCRANTVDEAVRSATAMRIRWLSSLAVVTLRGQVPARRCVRLAANPDGLVGNDALVEVKCPVTARNLTPQEARWNARAGETAEPRENPPASGIIRHDSHNVKILERPRRGLNPVCVGGRRARHMRNAGRPRSMRTVRLEQGIRQQISDMPSTSTYSMACQIGVTHSTAWDILWINRRHPNHWENSKLKLRTPWAAGRRRGELAGCSTVDAKRIRDGQPRTLVAFDPRGETPWYSSGEETAPVLTDVLGNRIRLERASQKQSSDTHKNPFDRVKRCRERKINIKAS